MATKEELLAQLERSFRRMLELNINNPAFRGSNRIKFDWRDYEEVLATYPDQSLAVIDKVIDEFKKPSNKETAKVLRKAARAMVAKVSQKLAQKSDRAKDLSQEERTEHEQRLKLAADIKTMRSEAESYILEFVRNISKTPDAEFSPPLDVWRMKAGLPDETVSLCVMFNVLNDLARRARDDKTKQIFLTIKSIQWDSVDKVVLKSTGKPALTLKDYEEYLNWVYFDRPGPAITEEEYNEGMHRFAFLAMAESEEVSAIHERLARRWEKRGEGGKKKADELRKIYQQRMKEIYNIHVFGRKPIVPKTNAQFPTPATVQELKEYFDQCLSKSPVLMGEDFDVFEHLFRDKPVDDPDYLGALKAAKDFLDELIIRKEACVDYVRDKFLAVGLLNVHVAVADLQKFLEDTPPNTLAGQERMLKGFMRMFSKYPEESKKTLGDWFAKTQYESHLNFDPYQAASNLIKVWVQGAGPRNAAQFKTWLDDYREKVDASEDGKVDVSGIWWFRSFVLAHEKEACAIMSAWNTEQTLRGRSDEKHQALTQINTWVDAVMGVLPITPQSMKSDLRKYFHGIETGDMTAASHIRASLFKNFTTDIFEAFKQAFEDPELGKKTPAPRKELLQSGFDAWRTIERMTQETMRQHEEKLKEVRWTSGTDIVLQKNDASRLHTVMEALEAMAESETEEASRAQIEAVLDELNQSQVFVVKHNWGEVFKDVVKVTEVNYNLPYPHCVFEFMISGKPLLMHAEQAMPDASIEYCALVQSKLVNGWAPMPESIWEEFRSKDKPEQETVFEMAKRQVIAICVALNSTAALTEVTRSPVKVNEKRAIKGKPLMKDFHVVDLARRVHARTASGPAKEYQGIIRAHLRRRHDRHYKSGEVITIDWMIVGNPDLGFVDRHYTL